MTDKRTAPFGSWASPITGATIAGQSIGIGGPVVADGRLYWTESRPSEGGRTVLVRRRPDGSTADLTPPPFNVRSRVHEYGGTALAIAGDTICFVNFSDQRLHVIDAGGPPRAITPELPLRFADLEIDPRRRRVLAVREDHRPAGEPANTIVAVDLDGDADGGIVLADGHDFFAAPRLSPDGGHLAWLSWDHPDMPWDATELRVADLHGDGRAGNVRRVAGGPGESVFQPEWSPDGTLHFVSDRTGWWNLYRFREGATEALCPRAAEFGMPLWQLGMRSYRFLPDGRILCRYVDQGVSRLAMLADGRLDPIETRFPNAGCPVPFGDRLAFVGASPTEPPALVLRDTDGGEVVLKRSASFDLDPANVSVGEPISFPTAEGATAHAFFYPPVNGRFTGPDGERPPLLVRSHGGPTAATDDSLALGIQYWTSRGFAVVDVNYRGSTGFGRPYREALYGAWGVADVDDCIAAARFLADSDRVDPDRLAIRGSSAGGYTTLCALTFHDVFEAGASHYGIGDLMALAQDTHKFESRYLDRLIGPLPECEARYRERSPIHFTDRLSCPVIFFQGLEDKVVPPNQAETMVAALRAKKLPVAHVTFPGEGHGFRAAANIERALDGELYFYGRVFGFTPAGDIESVAIDNL